MASRTYGTVTGTIAAVKYHGTSSMGNPTQAVYIDDDPRPYLTQSNSSLGYGIGNYIGREMTLDLTKAGRIRNAQIVE